MDKNSRLLTKAQLKELMAEIKRQQEGLEEARVLCEILIRWEEELEND